MECSIGYSFDGKEVHVELVAFEEVNMNGIIEYLKNLFVDKHEGMKFNDLKGLSILIK